MEVLYNPVMAMARNAAPGELDLVRRFVNTVDVESGRDRLGTVDGMAAWLGEQGLAGGGGVSEDERRAAIELREALRALLLSNHDVAGARVPPAARRTLNARARDLALYLAFDTAGRADAAGIATEGAAAALARVLWLVARAQADGTWGRLKACRADSCRWAYYDHSKNRSGKWCDMAVCGNRQKARRHRARRG